MAKERVRADRQGFEFGLLILRITDLKNVRRETVQLAKLLHRRLRETDEKGHLGFGRIGVLLPHTGEDGSQLVLDDVLRLAHRQKLNVEGEFFVYPDRPQRGDWSVSDDSDESTMPPSEITTDVSSLEAVTSLEAVAAMPRSVPVSLFANPYPLWKRGLDIAGASIGLAVAAPIIASAAVAIRITSPGPAFFAQDRVGYHGKQFRIYKLRTMVHNAEELKAELRDRNERDGPAFKMISDPRITRVGKFLRSTGMDELPQLLNVLKGDMAIVGPRPLPVDEHEQCEPWHRRRLDTKPGLTCYWQIAKSRKMSFAEWMRLDMRYARERSAWLDTKLVIKTISAVFLGRVGH